MGKKSLIKSTTKKKADTKIEEETPKKAAAKKTKKTTSKSAKKPASKTTKKSTVSTSKKSGAATTKKKAASAAKKTAAKKAVTKKATAKKTAPAKAKTAPKKAKTAKKAPKKVAVKELIFKKFEPIQALPKMTPAPKPVAVHASAPALISSSDPAEVKRLRALLFNQFDMDTVKAAAKEPAPIVDPTPVTSTDPEAVPAQTPLAYKKDDRIDEPKKPKADNAYVTIEPHEHGIAPEPMNRAVIIALTSAAIVVFLLLAISYNNSSKYYIYPKDNAIEIWKGRFSPKDNQFFMVLHGTPAAESVKATYTKEEVFPLVFDYYVNKADTLLEVPGLPDFEAIKTYLHQAEEYIVNNEMNTGVTTRLNNIERMILLYKADVAISKDTDDALGAAIKLLQKAGKLTPSTAQADEIAQKIERARGRRAALKSAAE